MFQSSFETKGRIVYLSEAAKDAFVFRTDVNEEWFLLVAAWGRNHHLTRKLCSTKCQKLSLISCYLFYRFVTRFFTVSTAFRCHALLHHQVSLRSLAVAEATERRQCFSSSGKLEFFRWCWTGEIYSHHYFDKWCKGIYRLESTFPTRTLGLVLTLSIGSSLDVC